MTREEALRRLSELSCAYGNVRMTECPHCAREVEALVKDLMSATFSADAPADPRGPNE